MELFNISAKFPITTSKVVLNIYHNKPSIRVASRIVNDLTLEIRKYCKKIKNWVKEEPPKNKSFVIGVKD